MTPLRRWQKNFEIPLVPINSIIHLMSHNLWNLVHVEITLQHFSIRAINPNFALVAFRLIILAHEKNDETKVSDGNPNTERCRGKKRFDRILVL